MYKEANADTKFCPLVLGTAVNYLEQFEKILNNDSKKLYEDRLLLFELLKTMIQFMLRPESKQSS